MTSEDSTQTVLILAPSENDGRLATQVLMSSGIQAKACDGIDSLCEGITFGCGAAVITEESLTTVSLRKLHTVLEKQATWSDLPIILLTSADVLKATELFSNSNNIYLLERPFARQTLIRSVQVALRARGKQYQIRDLMFELQKSKDDADRANVAKSQFLANMSHEIRTPIGAILGFLDLIKNSDDSEEEKLRYIEIVERNSNHLLRLIDDILDLSKVEAGKMSIENLDFHLGDFLAELASSTSYKATEKGLLFNFSLETAIPDRILGDALRLRQIIGNLLSNAIKFTTYGLVKLTVFFENDLLTFKVSDTGIGLTKVQAEKLFQPFAQADNSTTRKFGGTGLGLVLSRKLANILGGDVTLEGSVAGMGSTFVAKIKPVLPDGVQMLAKSELTIESSKKVSGDFNHALEGLKILLVEDAIDNQVLISTYLERMGAKISVRSNGIEGVESALKGNFDVILMDVQMPHMDGHEATKLLRRKQFSRPIIALTAHAMVEERTKCFSSGFSDYLTKPVQRKVLVETLQKYMKPDQSVTHH